MKPKIWLNREQNNFFLEAFKNNDYPLIKKLIDQNWAMPNSESSSDNFISGLGIACNNQSLISVKMIMEDMKYEGYYDVGVCIQRIFQSLNIKQNKEVLEYLLNPIFTDKIENNIRTKIISECDSDINSLKLLKKFDFKFLEEKNSDLSVLYFLSASSLWDEEFKFLLNNYDHKAKRNFFNRLSTQGKFISKGKLEILANHFNSNKEDFNLFNKFCKFYANRKETFKTRGNKEKAQKTIDLFNPIMNYLHLQEKIPNIDKPAKRSSKI